MSEVVTDAFQADGTAGTLTRHPEVFRLSAAPSGAPSVFVNDAKYDEWVLLEGQGVLIRGLPSKADVDVIYESVPDRATANTRGFGAVRAPDEIDWDAEEIDPAVYYQYRTAVETRRAAAEQEHANDRDDALIALAGAFVIGVGLVAAYDELF